jgi:hypothetical protein
MIFYKANVLATIAKYQVSKLIKLILFDTGLPYIPDQLMVS